MSAVPASLPEPRAYGRVAVIMGGWSAEREISLMSGQAVHRALREAGVDARALDADRQIVARLQRGDFDRAFLILHGRGGEDGQLQGALDILQLPYTGSGVLASALSMDKRRSKLLWRACDLPTPPWRDVESPADLGAAVAELGLPLMVKPTLEGSSVGITKLEGVEQLEAAWEAARRYGPVMAERFVDGEEYTLALLGDRVLPAIRLSTPRSFYDYQAKYFADDTRYECPCGLAPEAERTLAELAQAAYRALGARHWGRVDLMLDRAGAPWLIELNTAPGMTDHSLVPMAAKAAGMSFAELVLRILAQTLEPQP